MSPMLRMSRWLIPIVLVAICFAEDRNWEEANQLLVKASTPRLSNQNNRSST
jgi:hypothetical protein